MGCCKLAFKGRPGTTVAAAITPDPRLLIDALERMGVAAAILVGSVVWSEIPLAPSAVGRTRKVSPAALAPAVNCSVMPVPATTCDAGAVTAAAA